MPILEACLMSISDFLQIEEKEYGANDSAVTLNVVGHSLLAYLCLFTRRAVPSNVCLPLKLYSFGNSYKNNKKNSDKPNSVLLQCNQRRVLTAFALTDSSESVSVIMKEISQQLVNILKSLDIDYACYRQPSMKLLPSQRSSISFRIQTCASQSEHDIATVSDYGTFFSRRLRIMTENKTYLHCVYSEINIFCLLASFIERWWSEQDQSTLPPQNAPRV
ncbi:Serine--tRNA synthetase-like protein Slimp [Trichinella spiralis]|uniref:Serine--tRNA synthetase-like protein Slimp n=1 Tax=Trichinella spiralis TaxID=6334 RepID=A0ABR3K2L8_TRISP